MTSNRQEIAAFETAIGQQVADMLAPIREAYEEKRDALVREHRYRELAVFDALEELRSIESDCEDDRAGSRMREVIDDLEAVF